MQAPTRSRLQTAEAPVSISLPSEGAAARPGAARFDVVSQSGGRLLMASMADADVEVSRQRRRRATRSIAILFLAASLAVASGSLLDARRRARSAGDYALEAAQVAAKLVAARG